MKEIKFRAWHKTEKKMYSVSVLDFDHQDIMISDNWENFYDIVPMDEVEIMQSTWLKDKNGKEIFDGDIVKIELNWPFHHTFITRIWHENWAFWYYWWEKRSRFIALCKIFFTQVIIWECIEIIWNIHENGELLNF